MRTEEIEKLLAGYYKGSTSESEEEALKVYFRSENIPEYLQKDKKFFLALYQDTSPQVPAGLEEKLIRMIDTRANDNKFLSPGNKTRRYLLRVSGIAASLLLAVSIGYAIFDSRSECQTPKDTFNNPQEAYAVLQATLAEMSSELHAGVSEIQEFKDDFRKTNEQIIQDIQ